MPLRFGLVQIASEGRRSKRGGAELNRHEGGGVPRNCRFRHIPHTIGRWRATMPDSR